jgi:hypothetical protein
MDFFRDIGGVTEGTALLLAVVNGMALTGIVLVAIRAARQGEAWLRPVLLALLMLAGYDYLGIRFNQAGHPEFILLGIAVVMVLLLVLEWRHRKK